MSQEGARTACPCWCRSSRSTTSTPPWRWARSCCWSPWPRSGSRPAPGCRRCCSTSAIGIAIGEAGLGIEFESTTLTQVLGYSALVLILAEGGLTTSWSGIRASVAPAAVLSTLGVLVSVGVVSVAAHLLLHVSWTNALLVGAVLSSTDAAAVFSVLRRVPLPRRVTGMLEAESGFNDAPVVLLVVTLAEQSVPARRATRGGRWC